MLGARDQTGRGRQEAVFNLAEREGRERSNRPFWEEQVFSHESTVQDLYAVEIPEEVRRTQERYAAGIEAMDRRTQRNPD